MDDTSPQGEEIHVPVLVSEVLDLLDPAADAFLLDLTVGLGGHAARLLARLGPRGVLVGVDRDPEALGIASERLQDPRVELRQGNFAEIVTLREHLPRDRFDGILLDLGASSLQLDEARRGFSFRSDGPLDMRMGPDDNTARELVNEGSVKELARILSEYGEERKARRVAEAIVRARSRKPIATTGELAGIIRKAVGTGSSRIDPATRAFQAFRIAVNRELEALDRFLAHFDPLLSPGGRLAVLSYHSLEDRRVKNAFRERARTGDYELLTSRAIRPSPGEIERNPRSRSARLRGLQKKRREPAE